MGGRLLAAEIPEDVADVADQRDRGAGVFADFRRIHVDVDEELFLDELRIADRAVRDARAGHDDEVGLAHGLVAEGVAVVADHAEVERILGRHDGEAHHGRDDRDAVFFGKFAEDGDRVAEVDAAAGDDQRALGLLQGIEDPLHLQRVPVHGGLVAADLDFSLIGK